MNLEQLNAHLIECSNRMEYHEYCMGECQKKIPWGPERTFYMQKEMHEAVKWKANELNTRYLIRKYENQR